MKVSISQLKCFKACRRQYELRYRYGVEPVEKPDALQTGTSYHQLIEGIYANDKNDLINNPEFTKESAMARAYLTHLYREVDVKTVEEWVSYDLGNGDELIGRVDGIASDGSIVEHKTTSMEISDAYEFNLQWDEQILAYMLCTGARKIWYTVCRKPTIRLCKNETEEDFYYRMLDWYETDTDKKIKLLEITRTDEEVNAFEQDLRQMIAEVKHCEEHEAYYKNTLFCNCWGRRCEYSSICLHYDPEQEYVEFKRRESTR